MNEETRGEERKRKSEKGGGREREKSAGRRTRRSVKKSTLEKRVCGAAGAAGCVVVYRRNRVARYGTPRSLAARSRLLPAGRLHDTLFDIHSPYRLLTLRPIHGTSAGPVASIETGNGVE